MGLRELLARRGGISSIRNEVLRVISPDLTGQELHELLVSRDRSAAVCEREALLMPEDIRVSLQGVQRTVRAMAALNITHDLLHKEERPDIQASGSTREQVRDLLDRVDLVLATDPDVTKG